MNNKNKTKNITKQIISDNKKKKIIDEYKIIGIIGSGSFGEVYYAKSISTNRDMAAKVEDRSKPQKIISEYKIYSELRKNGVTHQIPKIYQLIQTSCWNIMFMQLLGSNLEEVFNNNSRKFSVNSVLYIGMQIMDIIEKIHNAKYIHRDIKPNNFIIGLNNNSNKIYITDFGLSKKYMDDNGRHINFRNDRSLIGTARYASINMHMGFEPSRRDDLESIGYMLVYFMKGSLPWQGAKKKNGKTSVEVIGDIKMMTSINKLCSDIPECFKYYIQYCRDLKYDQTPDYSYLKKLFVDHCKNNNVDAYADWH